MNMRLSGWVRLGIVASVVWAVGAYLYQSNADHDAAMEAGRRAYRMCADVESRKPEVTEYAYCRDRMVPAMEAYEKARKSNAVFIALAPIPFAWLFVYLVVLIWQWVAKGFKRERRDSAYRNHMDQKAFSLAKDSLQRVHQEFKAMGATISRGELLDAWSDFLTNVTRLYTRLGAATKNSPSEGWFGQIVGERKRDELLRYLLHARNADEHGIENIADAEGATLNLRAPDGAKEPTHIQRIVMTPKGGAVEFTGAPPKVQFEPGKIHLVTVKDRNGNSYPPPKSHRGKPLKEATALEVAKLACAYLTEVIEYAEKKHGR